MTYHYIYRIEHMDSLRIYVGQHSTNNLDDGYMGSGSHLKLALKKYGRQAFKKNILGFVSSQKELNELEAAIVTPEFVGFDWTFNLREGGEGSRKGWKHTPESRKKLSEMQKGKELSPKHKANIGAAHKGKKRSEEAKANFIKGAAGRRLKGLGTSMQRAIEKAKKKELRELHNAFARLTRPAREKIAEKAWRERNADKIKADWQAYYDQNKDELLQQTRARYARNKAANQQNNL